jgi:mttA/Hcf106 family
LTPRTSITIIDHRGAARREPALGIFEILLILVIALIVIPTDQLPLVMRSAGKVMRELRLASNTVMREISGAIGDEPPYNLLPPRFDDMPDPPVSAPTAMPIADASVSAEPAGVATSASQAGPSGGEAAPSAAVETAPSSHPTSPARAADKP